MRLSYSHPEPVKARQAIAIVRAALKDRLPIALTYKGRKVYLHCPANQEDRLKELINALGSEHNLSGERSVDGSEGDTAPVSD